MMNGLLNREECAAMRALAILGIVLHNFCHWLGPMVKENEYLFSGRNNAQLLSVLQHPDSLLPLHLLSYFGHYGVPVFLFLSGWGLVMKYEGTDRRVGVWPFVRYNYLKLLRLLLVGFVLFAMCDWATRAPHVWHWDEVVGLLLMYINVLPAPDHAIWPGPYWFFGLMMQFYIVYRLLLYRRSVGVAVALVAVCWLLQAVVAAGSPDLLLRLRYNFIGGMLPFAAGLLMARAARRGCFRWADGWQWWTWLLTGLACVLLTVAMCFSFHSWLWAPLFVVLGTLACVKACPAPLLQRLVWLGGLSACMFIVHPVPRKLFLPLTAKGDAYGGLLIYLLTTICLAWAVRLLMVRIPHPRLTD